MKTKPRIAETLARRSRWRSFNPIRGLTPERLSAALDQYRQGYLRAAIDIWDAIAERDDILVPVIAKRRKSPGRVSWEVLTLDDSPEAKRQADALRAFYDAGITARDAALPTQRGGLRLLLKQMMDAVGNGYALHELVWQRQGNRLTCEAWRVPGRYLTRETGELRYSLEGTVAGSVELAEGEWLTTISEDAPLMMASSIAYLRKTFALTDWSIYSESNGLLHVLFRTTAATDSEEWAQLENIANELAGIAAAVVHDPNQSGFENLGSAGANQPPYAGLVERMDRALTTIWRGGDLGTMSKGDGVGSLAQADEGDILDSDDLAMLEDALNTQLGRWFLRYHFGRNVTPLAYFAFQPDSDEDEKRTADIFEAAQRMGVPLSLRQVRERLTLATPEDNDDTLNPPSPAPSDPFAAPRAPFAAANATTTDADVAAVQSAVADALSGELTPLTDLLAEAVEADDPTRLQAILDTLPSLAEPLLNGTATEEQLRLALDAQAADGILAARAAQPINATL